MTIWFNDSILALLLHPNSFYSILSLFFIVALLYDVFFYIELISLLFFKFKYIIKKDFPLSRFMFQMNKPKDMNFIFHSAQFIVMGALASTISTIFSTLCRFSSGMNLINIYKCFKLSFRLYIWASLMNSYKRLALFFVLVQTGTN